jgi:hypothetical protein
MYKELEEEWEKGRKEHPKDNESKKRKKPTLKDLDDPE